MRSEAEIRRLITGIDRSIRGAEAQGDRSYYVEMHISRDVAAWCLGETNPISELAKKLASLEDRLKAQRKAALN